MEKTTATTTISAQTISTLLIRRQSIQRLTQRYDDIFISCEMMATMAKLECDRWHDAHNVLQNIKFTSCIKYNSLLLVLSYENDILYMCVSEQFVSYVYSSVAHFFRYSF